MPLEVRWPCAAAAGVTRGLLSVLWLQTNQGRLGLQQTLKKKKKEGKTTNRARTHDHKIENLVLDQLGYGTLMFIYEFCTIIKLRF